MMIDYSHEIIDYLEIGVEGNTQMLLFILQELYAKTKDPVFNNKIQELCKENELCTVCFAKLAVYPTYEVIGEYMGIPAVETVWNRRCEECGWRY